MEMLRRRTTHQLNELEYHPLRCPSVPSVCRPVKQVLESALQDIEKLVKSKRDIFVVTRNGLQAHRALAIQSHLRMVLHNKRKHIKASEIAAESQGFAQNWGGRMVQSWVQRWLKDRALPQSMKGRGVKAFTLLSDPAICAELHSYVRSNKWSVNPQKLAEFSKNNMVVKEAEKYLCHLVDSEMPCGLKRYMDLELFPRIHMKVGKGISV